MNSESPPVIGHGEPAALTRLLIRSALLGLLVPVTHADFWEVKAFYVVTALVGCMLLWCLERVAVWPFRGKLSVKPLHRAGYRGAAL